MKTKHYALIMTLLGYILTMYVNIANSEPIFAEIPVTGSVDYTTNTTLLFNTSWDKLISNIDCMKSVYLSISPNMIDEVQSNPLFNIHSPNVINISSKGPEILTFDIRLGRPRDGVEIVAFYREGTKVIYTKFSTYCGDASKDWSDYDNDGVIELITRVDYCSTTRDNSVIMPIFYKYDDLGFVDYSSSFKQYFQKYLNDVEHNIEDIPTTSTLIESYRLKNYKIKEWRENRKADLYLCQAYAQSLLGKEFTAMDKIQNWVKESSPILKSHAIIIYSLSGSNKYITKIDALKNDSDLSVRQLARQAKTRILNNKE
jgi:hypothetical protein